MMIMYHLQRNKSHQQLNLILNHDLIFTLPKKRAENTFYKYARILFSYHEKFPFCSKQSHLNGFHIMRYLMVKLLSHYVPSENQRLTTPQTDLDDMSCRINDAILIAIIFFVHFIALLPFRKWFSHNNTNITLFTTFENDKVGRLSHHATPRIRV